MSQRILIVDDEAHIVQVLSLKLRNAGYDVLTATDGEEALEIVRSQQPIDLIITDFQMPYMTGLELCQQLAREGSGIKAARQQGIKESAETARQPDSKTPRDQASMPRCLDASMPVVRDIPVLMLTARGYALDERDLTVGTKGADGVLRPMIRQVVSKPFSPRAILDLIQKILEEQAGIKASSDQGIKGGHDSKDSMPRSLDASMPVSHSREAA